MTAQEMWRQYSEKNDVNAEYEAWNYGGSADELAELTLKGIKTATSSAYPIYEIEEDEIPKQGEYSVILNSKHEAVCIIKTTKVYLAPFYQIDAQHAEKEGEGDRSLSYWKNVHREFFSAEMLSAGLVFDEDMKVVCEEFIRVYP